MNHAQAVDLLSQNAYVLREDLALMESGFIQCLALGVNATGEQVARLKANLSRLLEVIEAFGENVANDLGGEGSAQITSEFRL